ncbi:MAG: GNAT family N-acetyltransferase [Candidatus Thorarchaeota archaeon]
MKTLTKKNSEIEKYSETLKPYVFGYDERNVPYWVLVNNDQVVGIVVVGEEPLKVIEPLGTIGSVVLVVDYNQPAEIMDKFATESLRIAKEQNAVYSLIDLPEKYDILVKSFETKGYEEISRSLTMSCKLDSDYDQELSLRFERIERKEALNFLNKLKEFMIGSSDDMLEIIFRNLENFPEQFLDHWFQQELLYYVHEGDQMVGILDVCPNSSMSIANIGISPQSRGKGYGRQLMLYALNLLKEQGNKEAGLRVHPDNEAALQIYKSFGFKEESSKRALIWRK